jgi:hypothetical protein
MGADVDRQPALQGEGGPGQARRRHRTEGRLEGLILVRQALAIGRPQHRYIGDGLEGVHLCQDGAACHHHLLVHGVAEGAFDPAPLDLVPLHDVGRRHNHLAGDDNTLAVGLAFLT